MVSSYCNYNYIIISSDATTNHDLKAGVFTGAPGVGVVAVARNQRLHQHGVVGHAAPGLYEVWSAHVRLHVQDAQQGEQGGAEHTHHDTDGEDHLTMERGVLREC